jgi:hypothetical protein
MKYIHLFLLAIGTFVSVSITNAQTYKADVGVVVQEQNQWCWCANSKCILDYYGKVKKQCEITEYARTKLPSTFGSTNCCTSPTKCNKPNNIVGSGSIQDMVKYFGNIESQGKNALTLAEVKAELQGQRPFVIGIMWPGGSGGHVVVGCAYSGTSLTFMDPWQSNGMTTQAFSGGTSMTTATGSGTWKESLVITTPHNSAVTDLDAIANAVNVYPNPSSNGELTIHSDFAVKTINVFNATGQLVSSYSSITEKEFSFKVSAAGFYNVQVITENGLANKKVIIQ